MYINNGHSHELTKEMKEKTFEVKTKVTGEQIEDIIVTALEGGIGYWACLDNTTSEWENEPETLPTSQYAAQLLFEGKCLYFTDAESEDDTEVWKLTLDSLLKGIVMNTQRRPHDADLSDMDATTADCIFQYALFDEIVYG